MIRIVAKDNERKIDILSDTKQLATIRNFIFKINKIKKISSNLSKENITLIIMDNGKPLAKIGQDAKPGFSRFFTGKNMEIYKFSKKPKPN